MVKISYDIKRCKWNNFSRQVLVKSLHGVNSEKMEIIFVSKHKYGTVLLLQLLRSRLDTEVFL